MTGLTDAAHVPRTLPANSLTFLPCMSRSNATAGFPSSGYGAAGYGAAGSTTIPASAARSTSVPRPSSRTSGAVPAAGMHLYTQPAAGYSTTSVSAAAAAAAAHMGMRTHGVGAGAGGAGGVRSAVMPGSILDSLRTPSVVPSAAAAAGGSIASLALAQRVNSSSGLDYGSLKAGGASSSAVR
mgnify:CR=1 FL=1